MKTPTAKSMIGKTVEVNLSGGVNYSGAAVVTSAKRVAKGKFEVDLSGPGGLVMTGYIFDIQPTLPKPSAKRGKVLTLPASPMSRRMIDA